MDRLVEGFGKKLKVARIAAGFTQETLSEALEVDVMSVKNWEHERFRPRAWAVEKLETLLGIRLREV